MSISVRRIASKASWRSVRRSIEADVCVCVCLCVCACVCVCVCSKHKLKPLWFRLRRTAFYNGLKMQVFLSFPQRKGNFLGVKWFAILYRIWRRRLHQLMHQLCVCVCIDVCVYACIYVCNTHVCLLCARSLCARIEGWGEHQVWGFSYRGFRGLG